MQWGASTAKQMQIWRRQRRKYYIFSNNHLALMPGLSTKYESLQNYEYEYEKGLGTFNWCNTYTYCIC
jgi:hypothetical protein